MKRLAAVLAAVSVLAGGVVVAQSTSIFRDAPPYVVAEPGESFYSLWRDNVVSGCTHTDVWAFNNGPSRIVTGAKVEFPAACVLVDEATTTVPSTTTSTTTTLPPTTTSTTTATTTAPGSTTTTVPLPPPGVYVDEAAIPGPNSSRAISTLQVIPGGGTRVPSDGVSAFRTFCRPSHFGFIDPIIYPGLSRASHLHLFYGNTSVNEHSNLDALATTGASTCTGGIANRSSYWAPAMVDTRTGVPVYDYSTYHGGVEAYYKSGYQGVAPSEITNLPPGLRIIAGSSNSSGPQDRIHFTCRNAGGNSDVIIPCPVGDYLIMRIQFPQCWDGVNLDAADHKSHMAYGRHPSAGGTPGCPASHPVAIPEITLGFHYLVREGDDPSAWRLSSDVYDGPGGYSAHADWVNGWDPGIEATWVENCIQAGLDCGSQPLGDGRELDWISYNNLT